MVMIKSKHRYNILNGEELFIHYWQTMGRARSIAKLNRWLLENGKRNPNTGKPLAYAAGWWSLWRWAAENPQQAYSMWNDAMKDEGKFYTYEQFLEHAQTMMYKLILKHNKPRFHRWLAKHGQADMLKPEDYNKDFVQSI